MYDPMKTSSSPSVLDCYGRNQESTHKIHDIFWEEALNSESLLSWLVFYGIESKREEL